MPEHMCLGDSAIMCHYNRYIYSYTVSESVQSLKRLQKECTRWAAWNGFVLFSKIQIYSSLSEQKLQTTVFREVFVDDSVAIIFSRHLA